MPVDRRGARREEAEARNLAFNLLLDALSNKPLKLTILPQGHWCNIAGPARRQARSLTAERSTVAVSFGDRFRFRRERGDT